MYNIQGDVIGIWDNNGNIVARYNYNAWGKPISVTDGNGNDVSSNPSHIANINPIRYRGYYYDQETGFYYLQSRYYDPEIGRFINADNQLSTGSDLTGLNLFTYCGNNPVNRTDSTGHAWWHWAIGAAVVVACAVAVVATAGGAAAGLAAVAAVGNGMAAATTASTVAAGAFIGSATAFGTAALVAAGTSSTPQEFADQGNWGTVTATVTGATLGGAGGLAMSKGASSSKPSNISRGSTGRTKPVNLREQLAMEQVKSNPSAGTALTKVTLNDPRWSSSKGWIKMQQIVPTSKGNINIHYVYNQTLKIFDDFKFNP